MILALGIAGTIGFAMTPQAKAAGFLDDLTRAIFGNPTPPAAIGVPDGPAIRPKPSKPRPVNTRPAEPAVKLDPASDAYWYLRDPTLRKGDIVVTRSGIVVFDGQKSSEHASSAFTALEDTKHLPKVQQQTLEAAAARGRALFTPSATAPVVPTLQTKAEIGTTAQAQ
ncbi:MULTISPECIES: hypothetical protein [unclassified Bosea (in: a-proteobacteria)]|uniref:hypothetical protein n=1 Tax=unclassified Bosea (in: a-proteobacteria) TaxID=2653178 RepID=UPI00125F4930|nr:MULTISPECIES: hypothetical protein [unclassified Bosea (in: a-proteobacteria)]